MLRYDGPAVFCHWSDDNQSLCFNDLTLSINQFQSFTQDILNSAQDLCDRLMYHWSPTVSLDQIRDDFRNESIGYSFVADKRNNLQSAYLELSTRAATSTTQSLIHSQQWNMTAILQYLYLHEEFLSFLLLMCLIHTGQCPRPKELLTVQACNSALTLRNIFIHNGAIMYVIHYTKARRSTNQEFHVTRFFSDRARQVLFYYLVYIQPFVNFLLQVYYKAPPLNPQLFIINSRLARRPNGRC
jgi:hypothetical protein